MRVDISSIRYDVGASLKIDLVGDWKSLDDEGEMQFAQPVKTQLEFTNTGELFLAKGQIQAVLTISCSRCLELFNLEIETAFMMGYREIEKQGTTVVDRSDMDVRSFRGDEIDLAPDIVDAISLAMPMKPLCSQDCKGLCDVCGQNLNIGSCNCRQERIDPRLAVLREFIKN